MSAAEWTAAGAAVVAAIGAVGAIILQALQMYFTFKRATTIEGKVDDNTKITKDSAKAAVENSKVAVATAKTAATAATETKAVADGINKKLNGGIDAAIAEAIRPVKDKLDSHSELDDKNMREINEKIAKFTEYQHTRNHDIVTALQALTNQVAALIAMAEQKDKTSS